MKGYTKDRFTSEFILSPPLKLIGSKTRHRDIIYKFYPEGYSNYFEIFMGTAGLTIGSKEVNRELVNDINWAAINFYQSFQREPYIVLDQILQAVEELVPEDTEGLVWKAIRDNEQYFYNKGPREWAVWFYIITRYSMNGIFRRNKSGKCNSSWCKTYKGRGILTKDRVEKLHSRVKDIEFKNLPYQEVFETYLIPNPGCDGDTFLVVDPPYRQKTIENGIGCVTTYNGIAFRDKDHEELASLLGELDNDQQWLLTINDDPWIRELYRDYNQVEWQVPYSCSNTSDGRGLRPELLIANYNIIEYRDRLIEKYPNAKEIFQKIS